MRSVKLSKIKIGQQITPIELESIYGSHIHIPEAGRFTHLQFRRFIGCPICNRHIQDVIDRHAEILEAGIHEVVIFYSQKKDMLAHKPDSPFPLVADPNRELYDAFGVEMGAGSILHPAAWGPMLAGSMKHGIGMPGKGETMAGFPADFLIDENGIVIDAHYGRHASDQWTVDELLGKI